MVGPGSSNPLDAWLPRGPCAGPACESPVSLDGFGELGGDLHPPRPDARGMATLLGDVPVLHPSMLIVDGATVVDPTFPAPGGPWRPAPIEDFPVLPPPGGGPPPLTCARMALPPFADLVPTTQACFEVAGFTDWPPTSCEPPCLERPPGPLGWSGGPRGDRCGPPRLLGQAARTVRFVIPARKWLENFTIPLAGAFYLRETTIVDRDGAIGFGVPGAMIDYLLTAVQLILDDFDLLEWAVCLVDDWSRHAPRRYMDAFAPIGGFNTGRILPCMQRMFSEGFDIYLVARFANPATAGASDLLVPEYQPGEVANNPVTRHGLMFPVNLTDSAVQLVWTGGAQATAAGGASGLCSALGLATVLIHELMHECVDGETDITNCFALQNMAAVSFAVAYAKRHGCLHDLSCCIKITDRYFMTSEPRFHFPDRSRQGGGLANWHDMPAAALPLSAWPLSPAPEPGVFDVGSWLAGRCP